MRLPGFGKKSAFDAHRRALARRPGIQAMRSRRIALLVLAAYSLIVMAAVTLLLLGIWVPGSAW